MLALQPEMPSSQGIESGRQQQSPRNGEPLALSSRGHAARRSTRKRTAFPAAITFGVHVFVAGALVRRPGRRRKEERE